MSENKIEKLNEKSLDFSKMSNLEIQEFIFSVEEKMNKHEEKIDIPLKHHFSKDAYAREIFIPKGTLLVGKIHKFQNLNILSKGELSILSIDGVQRVKAPFTVVSSPGVKRLAYAHEDSVWTTIHGTNETDVEKIETYYTTNSLQEYKDLLEKNKENLCLM